MLRIYLISLLFISCQTVKLTAPINELKELICLNSRGKGRIIVSGRKQVFSYQTYYNKEDSKLDLDLTLPIYGTESVSVDYIGGKERFDIQSSFEKRLLRESGNVNPILIDKFLFLWAEFFEDILFTKKLIPHDNEVVYNWRKSKKILLASAKADGFSAEFEFKYLSSEGYFERMDLVTTTPNNTDAVSLELIVRKCLSKTE